MTTYNLNPDLARQGSGNGGGRITETGFYKGQLTKVRKADFGEASGLSITFVSDNNQKADFNLRLEGPHAYDEPKLHALLACLKVRENKGVQGTVEEYDYNEKKEVKLQAEIFPAMMNKPIGLAFQRREYISKSDGQVKSAINLFAPFTHDTEKLADELLDGSDAFGLEQMKKYLKDKTVNKPATQADVYKQPEYTNDGFDDDIPF